MPGIKEAKGFFYSLLIIGTLVMIASLYSTVWAAPSASPSQGVSGQTVPTPDIASLELVPPVAVPQGGAIKAFGEGVVTNLTSPDNQVAISIPMDSARSTGFLLYTPKTSADAPEAPPAGLAFGTVIFEFTVMDTSGVVLPSNTRFRTPMTISVKYTDADVQAAQGNPSRLVLYKYDSIFEAWTPLTTSVNPADGTLQVGVSRLGFFALMGQAQPPTPTPTPTATLLPGAATSVPPTATLLPPTPGDVAPGSGFLMGLLISAFILIAAGGYYLRQTKQS